PGTPPPAFPARHPQPRATPGPRSESPRPDAHAPLQYLPAGTYASAMTASTRRWWQETTIYQVYPRSFADSDGDGIGDLGGVIDHLDHLVDLGVGTVWLSPFFDSPQADYGYDISDYCDVAPEYGTLDDAQELIDEAHARGLKVMFDMVMNHTSDQHP